MSVTRNPIQILPPAVAERIAAGEVIERPSSVVKELVENALDAGATRILVQLEDGGKQLISVTDNGHGMDPESLWLSTRRHATSKLRTLTDLDRLDTLGFRGEALPSVAAVSDLSIVSRTAEANSAFELELTFESAFATTGEAPSPRKVSFGRFLDTTHGTRIQARGLFSQVPARLKFLRSQGAEVSQVREWLERLAIAHPETTFRLESDGRRIIDLDQATSVAERVHSVLADGEDYPIITEETDLVSLHWIQGLSLPHSRRLVQVVNGRAVRDRMLQQATLGGFRQSLLPGQFPAVALFVRLDPREVDVNVHPTKTEIRFLDTRKIFRAVDEAVAAALARAGAPAYVPGASRGYGAGSGREGGVESSAGRPSPTPGFYPDASRGWDFRSPPTVLSAAEPTADADFSADGLLSPGGRVTTPISGALGAASSGSFSSPGATSPVVAGATSPVVAGATSPVVAGATSPVDGARYVGILFNTYIAYEKEGELVLVDQHAADERIRYERLRRRMTASDGTARTQELLLPEAVSFAAEDTPLLMDRLPWLERLGFSTEIFGETSLLFRSIPAEWGTHSLRSRLKGLVERVIEAGAAEATQAPEPFSRGDQIKPMGLPADSASNSRSDSPSASLTFDETLFERLASEACHSSVRAGDRLEDLEARTLVTRLFECAHPWNCPHGRPTVVRIPRGRLEEWFQRRV